MDITQMKWGPDVSGNRPVKDWHALADSGATFFAAKATEGGTYVDPTFSRHRDGVRAFGAALELVVYYHFFRAQKAPGWAQFTTILRAWTAIPTLRSTSKGAGSAFGEG